MKNGGRVRSNLPAVVSCATRSNAHTPASRRIRILPLDVLDMLVLMRVLRRLPRRQRLPRLALGNPRRLAPVHALFPQGVIDLLDLASFRDGTPPFVVANVISCPCPSVLAAVRAMAARAASAGASAVPAAPPRGPAANRRGPESASSRRGQNSSRRGCPAAPARRRGTRCP